MKKVLIILVAIALSTMAQECESGEDTGSGDKVSPYIGGTSGMSIQFGEDAPPVEIFDNGQYPFDIDLKLLNVGEADIKKEDVKIKITGLNPQDYGKEESFFIKDGIQEDILATYKDYEGNVIKATDIIVTFPGLSFKSKLSGNQPFPVQADVCYKYRTEAVSTGCIRKDPLMTNTKAVCVVNEEKKVFNSGAPVQVTSFLEQPSGTDKIRYLITIKHVGSGDIYSPSTKCADKTVKNRVHVKIESSVTDLECVGFIGAAGKEGDVILRDGEYTFRCSQQKSSELDFEDRITVTMTYDYLESVSTSVLVKKSS